MLNKGVNGQRSDQILSRFENDVTRESPDAVIILAGVNDIFQGRDPEWVERNLDRMYSRARASNIVAVAATILPYDIAGPREVESMHEVNRWIEESSRRKDLLFCDTRSAVSRSDDLDRLASTQDALHPGVEGYRKMGEALARVLEKVF